MDDNDIEDLVTQVSSKVCGKLLCISKDENCSSTKLSRSSSSSVKESMNISIDEEYINKNCIIEEAEKDEDSNKSIRLFGLYICLLVTCLLIL